MNKTWLTKSRQKQFGAAIGLFATVIILLYQFAPAAKNSIHNPHSELQSVTDKFECARCHGGTGTLLAVKIEMNCVGCHQTILEGGFDGKFREAAIKKWQSHITHLVEVPSLDGTKRLRRDWIERFLQQPHVIRPLLGASMPRMNISPAEAAELAEVLSLTDAEDLPVLDGDKQRGASLFAEQGCKACHLFSGVTGDIASPEPAFASTYHDAQLPVRMAPDLRFTRDRMTKRGVLTWLEDPQKILPGALMPKPELKPKDRADLVAFILETPLLSETSIPQLKIAPLTRPVRYAEVEKRVFKNICWHCHSDPAGNKGDGGPGNTGGFGYQGAGLDLGTYEGVHLGALQSDGHRKNILQKGNTGIPILVSHMLARHEESAGRVSPVLGMPLGFPPLNPEDIALVWGWIEQGAKR